MHGSPPRRVLVVIDPSCQRPPCIADVARALPPAAHVVTVVLWPPPALTLDVWRRRWQERHRTLTTQDLVALAGGGSSATGADTSSVATLNAYHYRRSAVAQYRRVADAIAELCRIHKAALLVLPDSPLIDDRVRERVQALVPDVAITVAEPTDTRAAHLSAADASPRVVVRNWAALDRAGWRSIAVVASAIGAFVLAMNVTALAASVSPVLGLVALLITVASVFAVMEAMGEKLTPHAMSAVRRYCQGLTVHVRSGR